MLLQGMNPFKRSSYNHMAISYVGQTGTWKYADSTLAHGVVDEQPEREFLDKYEIVETFSFDVPAEIEQFRLWLDSHRGKKYDSMSILGLAGKLLYVFKRNPWGSDFKRMICSELILSMVVRFFDVSIGDSDDYDLVMTSDIVRSL
jgi:hypothetical protein